MKMTLIICLIPLFILYNTVIAYPSAPGTCNMNKMATLGHGPSKSTCPDCYGVDISTDPISNIVNIHLTGRFAYQGIVLLVKDKHTNKTLGEFQNFNEQLFTSVACDDDQDEEDRIEPDTIAVLGHIDAKLKDWPVNVGWNMVANTPLIELKLQGMIVIDYDNFHLLPETEFKIRRKLVNTTTTTISTSTIKQQVDSIEENTIEATHTIIQVEHEAGTFIQQQQVSNKLFIWVLTIFISVYFILSCAFHQWSSTSKRRRRREGVVDEISLVINNKKNYCQE